MLFRPAKQWSVVITRCSSLAMALLLAGTALLPAVYADEPAAPTTPAPTTAATIRQSVEQGVAYLKAAQSADGSWTTPQTPGITGLAALALLKSGVPASDPVIVRAIQHLKSFQQPNGGLYSPAAHHGNYETAISLLVLRAAGGHDELASQAETYLRDLQWDESEQTETSDARYGGAGYGRTGDRPDLSNTTFFLDALQASGADQDDPAVQRALVFLSRCQNLETEHNTTAFAAKVNDGGFYYTPAAGGNSQAGNTPEGGLRSYASMTYAGLKSMIYAGLSKDDPRVQAATEWIRKFYTLDENPGMGQQGLYYYFHIFAKSMAAMGEDTFVDASGVSHNWREELGAVLVARQQSNGSWLNAEPRWMEGDPSLATSYALLALSISHPVSADATPTATQE